MKSVPDGGVKAQLPNHHHSLKLYYCPILKMMVMSSENLSGRFNTRICCMIFRQRPIPNLDLP